MISSIVRIKLANYCKTLINSRGLHQFDGGNFEKEIEIALRMEKLHHLNSNCKNGTQA